MANVGKHLEGGGHRIENITLFIVNIVITFKKYIIFSNDAQSNWV